MLLACSDIIELMLDDVEGGGDSSSVNPDEQVKALKQWLSQDTGKPKGDKAKPAVIHEGSSSKNNGNCR